MGLNVGDRIPAQIAHARSRGATHTLADTIADCWSERPVATTSITPPCLVSPDFRSGIDSAGQQFRVTNALRNQLSCKFYQAPSCFIVRQHCGTMNRISRLRQTNRANLSGISRGRSASHDKCPENPENMIRGRSERGRVTATPPNMNLRDLVILVADPSSYISMLIHGMLRGFGSIRSSKSAIPTACCRR